MGDIGHDRIGAPALDEGAQLVLDILRLLPRQPRHREPSEVSLRRQSVAGLAIFNLGFEAAACAGADSFLRWPQSKTSPVRAANAA